MSNAAPQAAMDDTGEDAFLMQFHLGGEFGDDYEGPVNRIAQYEER